MENGNFTGCQVMLVDLAEYNAMMNASENLEPDEALAYVNQNDSVGTTLAMDGGKTYHVKKSWISLWEMGWQFTVRLLR